MQESNFSVDRGALNTEGLTMEQMFSLNNTIRAIETCVNGGDIEQVGQIAAEIACLNAQQMRLFKRWAKDDAAAINNVAE